MAIVNLDVNVRVRDRFEFKVNSRSGTRLACLPSPFTTVRGRRPSRRAVTAACPTRRRFKAIACYSLLAVAQTSPAIQAFGVTANSITQSN